MEVNLKKFIEANPCQTFRARPHYFREGDFVTYYLKDETAYEERIDELVTVYRSIKTNEMVGCKIKGVHRIMETLGEFGFLGVLIKDKKMFLGLLIMGAAIVKPEARDRYNDVGNRFGNAVLDPTELQPALAA